MRTIFAILLLAGCVMAQQKAPTVEAVELGDCQAQVQKYIGAALQIQSEAQAELKAYQDTARSYHALRDSLRATRKK